MAALAALALLVSAAPAPDAADADTADGSRQIEAVEAATNAIAFRQRSVSVTDDDGNEVVTRLPADRVARIRGRSARYEGAGFDLTSEAADGWATTLIEVPGEDSPTRYRFRLDLPRRWALESQDDGSVAILDQMGKRAGTIAPPWATDADGNDVQTTFTVKGRRRLVQTVAHRGAVYPVTADPSVTHGRNVYLWFRGYEIRWWGSSSAAFLSAYMCAVYGSLHPVLCAIGAVGALWLISAFRTVFSGDRCRYVVAMRYGGWPNYMERLKRYGCTYRKSEIPG